MKLRFEVETNPGENAWFVAEVKLANREFIYSEKRWWGIGGSFWIFKPKLWKEWLCHTDIALNDEGWSTFNIRLCGFEMLLETYKGEGKEI